MLNNTKQPNKNAISNITEKDVSPYIISLDDHYILEGSSDIDQIDNVEVDDSNVDLSTPEKYPVRYQY